MLISVFSSFPSNTQMRKCADAQIEIEIYDQKSLKMFGVLENFMYLCRVNRNRIANG